MQYAIRCFREVGCSKQKKVYFESLHALDIKNATTLIVNKRPARTLLMNTAIDPAENDSLVIFEDLESAKECIEILKQYQQYDVELIGPYQEGCKFNFEIEELPDRKYFAVFPLETFKNREADLKAKMKFAAENICSSVTESTEIDTTDMI